MTLYIQDPISPTAPSLHELLLTACKGAIDGGGAFAFASKEGGELLLRDKFLTDFVKAGSFDLIVGIDEITNVRALEALSKIREEFPNIKVRVFYHDYRRTFFHPKFCWFRYKSGGVLITGSGNLTIGGLRGNWEAFTGSFLSPKEIDEIEQKWRNWVDLHENLLRPPNDDQVLRRAAENIRQPILSGRKRIRPTRVAKKAFTAIDDKFELPQLSTAVLIAEIPRASTRWSQANFDMDNFQTFFGITIGKTQQRVLLQHVDVDGTLCPIETRPGVYVRSQNYRLELAAASGLDYPDTAPPIGVFIRVATRTFRYRLLMPDDPHYQTISNYLDNKWKGRTDRMRRILTNTEELKQIWPNSPLWFDA